MRCVFYSLLYILAILMLITGIYGGIDDNLTKGALLMIYAEVAWGRENGRK